MKKTAVFTFISLFLTSATLHAAKDVRHFQASGEVVTVDPVYSQITIEHPAIRDFSSGGQTQFYVSSADLLKGLAKRDLVDFEFTDNKGDVKIDKITKTGMAPPKQEGIPVGQAVQGVLQGTGEVVKTVTSPIPPVSEALGGAVDSTASATDPKVKDGEVKQKLATF